MTTCKLAWMICALVGVALAAPAGASATTSFGCRASAVRAVFPPPVPAVEPTVANGAISPCTDVGNTSTGSPPGPQQVGASGAFTHVNAPFQGRGAGAFGYASKVTINSASDHVVIASAQAQALNTCNGHTLVSTPASQVTGLTVDGKSVASTATMAKIPIGSDGSYILINQTVVTPTTLTRTAAFVHLAGFGDFVVAEAVVSHTRSACAGSRAPSAIVEPCPLGSNYDPATHGCVITQGTKTPIPVGTPFRGPAGGQVLALASAHVKSPCLHGRGSAYVVLAIPGAGLVTGTSGPDRIVARSANYHIVARGGRDCIDVSGGNNVVHDGNGKDRIFATVGFNRIFVGNGKDVIRGGPGGAVISAGNGNDRIFAGAGFNRIFVGNGKDVIHAGPGVDKITAGNGNDLIYAAPGVDRISVGNGNDHIFGSLGLDKIFAGNGNDVIRGGPGIAKISAGTGKDVIFSSLGHSVIRALGGGAQVVCGGTGARVSVAPSAVPFAVSHGCKGVTVL